MREGLTAAVAQRPGPCPLDIPVTGQIAGKALAGSARLQRGPDPDAAPGHGGVHRLRLPDRHAPRGDPGPAHRMLPRPRPRPGRAARTAPDPRPRVQERHRRGRQPPLRAAPSARSPGSPSPRSSTPSASWSAWSPTGTCCSTTTSTTRAATGPGTGSLKHAALRKRIEDFVAWANREAAGPGPARRGHPRRPARDESA